MSRRVEVVEECEHGFEGIHWLCDGVGYPEYDQMAHTEECECSGGSRRVLTEGEFLRAVEQSIRANLFDGQDGGQINAPIDWLITEAADAVLYALELDPDEVRVALAGSE